jgi:hypothetical protein
MAVPSASGRNHDLSNRDWISDFHMAAPDASHLAYLCPCYAQRDRNRYGNVFVRLDHDHFESGGVRAPLDISQRTHPHRMAKPEINWSLTAFASTNLQFFTRMTTLNGDNLTATCLSIQSPICLSSRI